MKSKRAEQSSYLFKVVMGIMLLAIFIATTAILADLDMQPSTRLLAVLGLSLPCVFIYTLLQRLHNRSDELLQKIHYRACLFSAAVSASVFAIAGICQANHLLGQINFIYAFLLIAASWAMGLMLADRSHH